MWRDVRILGVGMVTLTMMHFMDLSKFSNTKVGEGVHGFYTSNEFNNIKKYRQIFIEIQT